MKLRVRTIGIALIRFYQMAISPWLPASCRYEPSCSEYSRQAIERFGLVQGCWLGLRRLLRCHPFHAGGFDPVPSGEPPPISDDESSSSAHHERDAHHLRA